jgi:DNA-binding beta-propeller fold protein YncE
VDVIDTASLTRAKSIPVKGAVHNTYVTPDGKFVVSGSIASKTITVIDQKTEEPAWSLTMDLGIRPMAFSTNADGSTKWIFVQLSNLNGFAVVDFATQKEVNRIKLPELPAGKAKFLVGGNESHGMAVTADGKTLVVNSRLNSSLYSYSLPDLKLVGTAEERGHANSGRRGSQAEHNGRAPVRLTGIQPEEAAKNDLVPFALACYRSIRLPDRGPILRGGRGDWSSDLALRRSF